MKDGKLHDVCEISRIAEHDHTIFRCWSGFILLLGRCSPLSPSNPVLLVMRVYAYYQRKTWILWATVPLGVVTVGISAVGPFQLCLDFLKPDPCIVGFGSGPYDQS